MFEGFDPARQARSGARAVGFAISVAAHLTAIGAVALLPLLFVRALEAGELLTFLIAPPPPPPPVPPPRPISGARGPDVRREPVPRIGFEVPTSIPATIPAPNTDPIPLGVGLPDGISAGGGVPAGVGTDIAVGAASPDAPPAPLPKPPPPAPKRAPQRIGGDVQESKLIHRVDPVYPELAKRARMSGVVILEVNVDEEGSVASVRVLRGQPLLDEGALTAVRQWRYSPTLLNGEPVPVIATVTVIFNLR